MTTSLDVFATECAAARIDCKVGFVREDVAFTTGMCTGALLHANATGWEVESTVAVISKKPALAEMTVVLERLRSNGVNVLIGCTYYTSGISIINALEAMDYSPVGVSLSATVQSQSYESKIKDNGWWQGEYVIGPTVWHRSLPQRGLVSGMTSLDFHEQFAARHGGATVGYHGASNFGLGCLLVAAIESAGTLATLNVSAALRSVQLQEFYTIKFDSFGQNSVGFQPIQFRPRELQASVSSFLIGAVE